jgi:putative endopeptidase
MTKYNPALLTERLDETVRPQDDFFNYVNAKWIRANPIPDSESRWGTFSVLRDQAWQHMREIYDELTNSTEPAANSVQQQARDLYHTAMHVDDYTTAHLELIQQYFKKIDSIQDATSLSACIGELQAIGIGAPWNASVEGDDKDSSKHIFHLGQGGLTLPDRDYYLTDNQAMADIRQAYASHLDKIQTSFTDVTKDTEKLSGTITEFEHELATIARSSADLRDIEKNYNKTTYDQLKQTYSNIDWPAYAAALGWKPDDKISVDQPEFLAFINKRFTAEHLATWRTYLKWQFLAAYYGRINEQFAKLKFEFFGTVLSGTKEMMPKWKRAVTLIDHVMGEGVGKLYAEKHFPESSKQQVLDIVELIRATYKKRIENLDWMAEPTKTYALKKLANIKVLAGYPSEWRDFSELRIGRESFMANVMAGEKFQIAYYLRRLHEPTSREDWFMYPQTVNAYHDPNRLVICFPAAILQPPFFSPDAPMANNLGGIGTVIGHELTHGFDDQGSQFDAEGNVRDWQTKEDHTNFDKQAQVIIDQADQYEVLPGLHLQGKLVIGESIADLGGLEIAYDALTSLPKSQQVGTGNLSADQLFFAAFAITESESVREAKAREYAISDPHPNSEFRVNGILQHVDGFYKAFGVTESDSLYRPPEERTRIW